MTTPVPTPPPAAAPQAAPAPAPHSTLFRQLYALLARVILKHLPSPVTEVLGGVVIAGIGAAAVLLAIAHPGWAVFAACTAFNVVYALRLDPNDAGQRTEVPDFGIREVVIIAGAVLIGLLRG